MWDADISSDSIQRIPALDRDLFELESQAMHLLPQPMRVALPMDVVCRTEMPLSGIVDADGESGEPGMLVLCVGQKDRRKNGAYAMLEKDWKRITAPDDPRGTTVAYRATYRINRGRNGPGYYWVVSMDPLRVGVSILEIERLGDNLFDSHFRQAEKQLFQDIIEKNHQPILPTFLAAPQQLTPAKMYLTLHILFQQAIAGTVSGIDADQHERQSQHWRNRYEQERRGTLVRLIDGARQHIRRRRCTRG